MSAHVRDPAFRRFDAWRVEANDATEASLLGLRLGREYLSRLPPMLRREPLPEIVDVPESERMRLSGDAVIQKLIDAERFWAAMAIPFAFSVLSEYLADVLTMFDDAGVCSLTDDPRDMQLGALRDTLGARRGCNVKASARAAKTLDFAQRLRNNIVHSGGYVNQQQIDRWTAMPTAAKRSWERAARRTPTLILGALTDLGPGEVRATLSATHGYAREINLAAAKRLPKAAWAGIAVDDWRAEFPHLWDEKSKRLKRLRTYAEDRYTPVELIDDDLKPFV